MGRCETKIRSFFLPYSIKLYNYNNFFSILKCRKPAVYEIGGRGGRSPPPARWKKAGRGVEGGEAPPLGRLGYVRLGLVSLICAFFLATSSGNRDLGSSKVTSMIIHMDVFMYFLEYNKYIQNSKSKVHISLLKININSYGFICC